VSKSPKNPRTSTQPPPRLSDSTAQPTILGHPPTTQTRHQNPQRPSTPPCDQDLKRLDAQLSAINAQLHRLDKLLFQAMRAHSAALDHLYRAREALRR